MVGMFKTGAEFLAAHEWIKGAYAMDGNGIVCDPRDHSAQKFCLVGAVVAANEGIEIGDIERKLDPYFDCPPIDFNDHFADSKEQVIDRLMEIDKVEEEKNAQ